ncbi:MAG TPA: [Fe-Fe] hydrogenase large subunit C-terminal domain-containing protein [Candidatus Methylomirabilis sp.]|nr:[Fe-Fe] hydrogenase large subunit C-terminal domain-containing protein [Candidatus Methylomirabilis sp.]
MTSVTPMFVETIKARCRVCYTCVRECPAKAIRIVEGQAEILAERCIACGNCVRVCSQHAKQAVSTIDRVRQVLGSGVTVAACLAPSFPAEFSEVDPRVLVGMLRALGFGLVTEVAFGADLVAQGYRNLVKRTNGWRFIATTCPAIVSYVEKYHPALVEGLAPIVSPMVAMARALRRIHGDGLKVVFIGPCIAKQAEASSPEVGAEVDVAMTFGGLRTLFAERGITASSVHASDFDPPHPGAGALFPVGRGMLQAAEIREDLLTGDVVAAEGRREFVEVIKAFEAGHLTAKLLEVLCCDGCIMGPGMTVQSSLFTRRASVSQYVRRRMATFDASGWQEAMAGFADLDLTRTYHADDQRIAWPTDQELAPIMERMGKHGPEDELNCGACGYDTCVEHAVAIHRGLAGSEMCLPYTIEQLHKTIRELAVSHEQLANTQEALMQSEKLASMGQLAAGVAHEVNNPLGVVLMYTHLLLGEIEKGHPIREDLAMIAEQADRCKKIVAGLLDFARQNRVLLQTTDVRELVERSLRAVPAPEHIRVEVQHGLEDPLCECDVDQMIQVVTNLISNALAAMPEAGTLQIRTGGDARQVRLEVRDSGTGILKEHMSKIFTPFFTTKRMGKGTGLGLAVTYGIVKMHRGEITVKSNADPAAGPTGTTFIVSIPRQGGQE